MRVFKPSALVAMCDYSVAEMCDMIVFQSPTRSEVGFIGLCDRTALLSIFRQQMSHILATQVEPSRQSCPVVVKLVGGDEEKAVMVFDLMKHVA